MITSSKTVSVVRKKYQALNKDGESKQEIVNKLIKDYDPKLVKKYLKEYPDLTLLDGKTKNLNYLLVGLIFLAALASLLTGSIGAFIFTALIGAYVSLKRRSGYFMAMAIFGFFFLADSYGLLGFFSGIDVSLLKPSNWFLLLLPPLLSLLTVGLSFQCYRKLFPKI